MIPNTLLPGVFEYDQDIGIAVTLGKEILGGQYGPEFAVLLSHVITRAPAGFKEFYDKEYRLGHLIRNMTMDNVREKLDAGMGDEIMQKYRALVTGHDESVQAKWNQDRVLVLGTLMMSVVAKIKEDDMQHLRELAWGLHSPEGYTLPFADQGFRGPGKRQLIAALESYSPGTPRDFHEPSCHACGKSKEDIGKSLKKCSKCRNPGSVTK